MMENTKLNDALAKIGKCSMSDIQQAMGD